MVRSKCQTHQASVKINCLDLSQPGFPGVADTEGEAVAVFIRFDGACDFKDRIANCGKGVTPVG